MDSSEANTTDISGGFIYTALDGTVLSHDEAFETSESVDEEGEEEPSVRDLNPSFVTPSILGTGPLIFYATSIHESFYFVQFAVEFGHLADKPAQHTCHGEFEMAEASSNGEGGCSFLRGLECASCARSKSFQIPMDGHSIPAMDGAEFIRGRPY